MGRWPGPDGLLVSACAALVTAAAVSRGVPDVAHLVLIVLALDALYLGATWLSRR